MTKQKLIELLNEKLEEYQKRIKSIKASIKELETEKKE